VLYGARAVTIGILDIACIGDGETFQAAGATISVVKRV
jgi:hypothetical protein|tara:strand:- start:232 stop:345 length:114 start_codon:yes stop_codon:yes gene_type:complete